MKAIRAAFLGLLLSQFTLVQASTNTQSIDVDGVGYVNIDLPPGFSLIHNPLIARDNRVAALFNRGNLPDGFSLFWLEGGESRQYEQLTWNAASAWFEPGALAEREMLPGQGFWVLNPGPAQVTVTFAGEVPQGKLSNSMPRGFSIVGSMIPAEKTPADLGFPAQPGDIIYFWDVKTQKYRLSMFDDESNTWIPPLRVLNPGEAFIIRKLQNADWIQSFSVNSKAKRRQAK